MSLCLSVWTAEVVGPSAVVAFKVLSSVTYIVVPHTQLGRGTKTIVLVTASAYTSTEQPKETSVWCAQCGLDGVLQYFRPMIWGEKKEKRKLSFPKQK